MLNRFPQSWGYPNSWMLCFMEHPIGCRKPRSHEAGSSAASSDADEAGKAGKRSASGKKARKNMGLDLPINGLFDGENSGFFVVGYHG